MTKLSVLVVLLAGILAGCNTVQGVGRDISAGGRAIERVAK
ncbi:MAG: entericidin A/B family lipoprotein [Microvirgula sp.]|nr:entericidin A/B family lipoprotein [Microvirgula aerodenitrificans]